jgi:hypothetical protein
VSESTKIKHEVELDVQPLEFQRFDTVHYLDPRHFASIEHARIEIGQFKGECCHRIVYAVIKKGVVTALEMDPCAGGARLSKELAELVKSITRKMRRDATGAKLPIPLDRFIETPDQIVIETWTCIRICVWGVCVTCCQEGDWVNCASDQLRQ